ncbi:MAG: lactonase family protein [Bacteroidota bacterium]
MKIPTYILTAICSILLLACEEKTQEMKEETTQKVDKLTAYIGTYTRTEGHVDGKAEGIYEVQIDASKGEIVMQKTVAELINPSFVKLSKNKTHLYAISELAQEQDEAGLLYNYKITSDSLQLVQKLSTTSKSPCHIAFDQSGTYVFVTNYLGGKFKVYKRNEDGTLTDIQMIQLSGSSVHPQQTEPLLHSTKVSPDNQYIAVADKGTDKIWLFMIDEENEMLVPHSQPFVEIQAGAGPRHLAWSADGKFLYVINELDNTVNVIQHKSEDQSFASIQSVSTLPEGYEETSYCADIHLHPNGKFLYGSNRGHNSIAMYGVDTETGKLTILGIESTRGKTPRNFSIGPKGNFFFAANQDSDNITTYQINEDGTLQFLDLDYEIKTPVCIEY